MKKILTRCTGLFLLIVLLAPLSACKDRSQDGYSLELEVWGVFDEQADYNRIFRQYIERNPFVTDIKFRKFTVENYERDLLDALASGNGPDIFMIHNTWLPSYQDKIAPAPEQFINESKFRENFVEVAADDFIRDGEAYAVPLSVDSLGLYYNRDLFNEASITRPPRTWTEFSQAATRLTKFSNGKIVQSGATFGTAQNVNRSTDLLGLLMLQNGTQMVDNNLRAASFATDAGTDALRFYTDFANPSATNYSWNNAQHYSIDSFFEGTAGMMIGYSYHYETIKRKNEKLRFGVAPVPQFQGRSTVNYANYWAYAVAVNKNLDGATTTVRGEETLPINNDVRIHESWELLNYLTTVRNGQMTLQNAYTGTTRTFALEFDPAQEYLNRTGKPAARRDLLEAQFGDVELGPFSQGNLTARSWYQTNPNAIEAILAESITNVNFGRQNPGEALRVAENRVTALMR